MRLPLFDMMDSTISLLAQRSEYYNDCANELQALIKEILSSDALLGVHVRVKSEKSLREKMLRKQLYMQYNDQYDVLNNLSDLIGLRAECRFMREENELYQKLCDACILPHGGGTFSLPSHPTIRFALSIEQPQQQQNGLSIYRIDGKYHKNGVSVPFELQIKSLVHVFWAEVEHQLIYKNNSYILMDDFLKKLLYSNYDNLKQMDASLQLLYDHMQVRSPDVFTVQYANMQPLLAKTISDVFLQRMQVQMGYSLRLNNACDILAQYLLTRSGNTINPLHKFITQIHSVSLLPLTFDDTLELEGAYFAENAFHNAIGLFLSQQININYEWNVFFRMLFTLEEGNHLDSFSSFIEMYCGRFENEELYEAAPSERQQEIREQIFTHLSDILVTSGDISILFEKTICKLENAIRDICAEGCDSPELMRLCLQCAVE